MVPLVVIELPPARASMEQAAVMVEACSAALRPGRCELEGDADEHQVSALAVVSLSDAPPHKALVDVGKRSGEREIWLSEELSFRVGDASLEQFRSIGLTIAVLFRELSSPEVRADARSAPRAKGATLDSRAKEPPPASATGRGTERDGVAPSGDGAEVAVPPPEPRLWIGAGPTVRASVGFARFGAGGSLGLEPLRPLLVGLSARYEQQGENGVTLTMTSLGAGAGAKLALARVAWLRGRAEAVAERHAARATQPGTGAVAHRSLWTWGFRGVVDLVWSPTGFWGVSVSGSPQVLARATTVTLYDSEVLTVPRVTWGGGVALELYPWAWTGNDK